MVKTAKKIILLFTSLMILSCIEENEGRQTVEKTDLTTDFILKQKWYVRDVFSLEVLDNGTEKYESLSKGLDETECIFDLYYEFYENETLDINMKDKNCENKETISSTYKLDEDKNILELGVLFGFKENHTLENVRFYNSLIKPEEGDSIRGEFDYEIKGKKVKVVYQLSNKKFVPYYKGA